jgi:hypothetical protein
VDAGECAVFSRNPGLFIRRLRRYLEKMRSSLYYLSAGLAAVAGVAADSVNTTVCNGKTFVYEELAGYGYLASDFQDRYGDSVSLGSSIALDRKTWTQKGDVYEGVMYSVPGKCLFLPGYRFRDPEIEGLGKIEETDPQI